MVQVSLKLTVCAIFYSRQLMYVGVKGLRVFMLLKMPWLIEKGILLSPLGGVQEVARTLRTNPCTGFVMASNEEMNAIITLQLHVQPHNNFLLD